MLSEEDYGTPFDYYLAQLTEINMNFKFYWSQETYFYQKTIAGQEASTIQND